METDLPKVRLARRNEVDMGEAIGSFLGSFDRCVRCPIRRHSSPEGSSWWADASSCCVVPEVEACKVQVIN